MNPRCAHLVRQTVEEHVAWIEEWCQFFSSAAGPFPFVDIPIQCMRELAQQYLRAGGDVCRERECTPIPRGQWLESWLSKRAFWVQSFAPYRVGPKTALLTIPDDGPHYVGHTDINATTPEAVDRFFYIIEEFLIEERALLTLRTISEHYFISATDTFVQQLRARIITAALPDTEPTKKRKVCDEKGVQRVQADRTAALKKLEEEETKLLVQTFQRLQKIAAQKAELDIKVAAAEQEAAKRARITIEQE